ncbi:SUKH-3 domain-containing protein [Streptomyces orinoci]|uniref:SUKH-3 domain-containing protein n=1 Tax=Streptomyces orinoci TaxID=67339 RepID=A0ABV3K0T0_STRON|nr:SUKH-3 domain-containing protein [Streptomyces orinoci]
MNGTPERRAIQELRDALSGTVAELEIHPMDVTDACHKYAEEGYEVTDRLREFLERYGELTVTWHWRGVKQELTTSVERTLESTHAMPRTLEILAKRLGQPLLLVGTVFDTEDAVLLAENRDILFYSDAGFQRVAGGFGQAVLAVVTDAWDKTFFGTAR